VVRTAGDPGWIAARRERKRPDHPRVIPRLGRDEPDAAPVSAAPRDPAGVPRGPGAAASRMTASLRSRHNVAAAACGFRHGPRGGRDSILRPCEADRGYRL